VERGPIQSRTGRRSALCEGLYVTGDFFRVLGVPAFMGRTFTVEDDDLSCNSQAQWLVTHLLQSAMAGDSWRYR